MAGASYHSQEDAHVEKLIYLAAQAPSTNNTQVLLSAPGAAYQIAIHYLEIAINTADMVSLVGTDALIYRIEMQGAMTSDKMNLQERPLILPANIGLSLVKTQALATMAWTIGYQLLGTTVVSS